jgi:hypothetical protein
VILSDVVCTIIKTNEQRSTLVVCYAVTVICSFVVRFARRGAVRVGPPAVGLPPKIRERSGGGGAAQIVWNSIDTYPSPRRLSGHQLFENGRSGYAEKEDHKQDC